MAKGVLMGAKINPASIRKDFPILKQKINGRHLVYLDSAATSQKPKQVIEAEKIFYETINANVARSVHYLSEKATEAYEASRKKVADFVNAGENEIIFVYCNAAGKLRLDKFQDTLIGHSQIAVPFKGAIKKLDHNKEEMFIQEVDTAILKDAEKAYKIRNDLKSRILY